MEPMPSEPNKKEGKECFVQTCWSAEVRDVRPPTASRSFERLKEEIKAQGLEKEVNVIRTGCFGLCALGPIMVVYPEGAFYSRVTPEDVPEIVSEHLLKGRIVKRLLYQETVVDDNTTKSLNETTFYAKQMRIALRNCGVINPENIDEYIAQDGYAALGKVLTEMTPRKSSTWCWLPACGAVAALDSPTGRKWQFAAASKADRSMLAATPTKATPVPLWTVPCWRAIPTACWRPWPLPAMPSAHLRATSTSVPSTPSP